ncbi:MAG: DUF4416 family protein [candidate division Zixibacteria bacterium]|nr:DUF4416 family protein [candidate division Zixibacteria bacterium]
MARIQKPPAGRLIVAVIHAHIDACADALNVLEKQFGRIQAETTDLPCTNIDQYAEEMGDSLVRRFFAFERPIDRDRLPEIKSICHKIESQFGDAVDDYTFRTVNLDPGIVTPDNVVMVSHREYNHRIYLTNGVFAELVLVWSKNGFARMPWTPADFYHDESIDFFLRIRESFDKPKRLEPSRT